MNLVQVLTRVLADPTVRAIVLPIAEAVIAWVRSGKPVPEWLDLAELDVPDLRAPLALERAKLRRDAALRRATARG